MIPEGGRTSYAGDVLAIVVAETRQQARAAAELVEVDYERAAPDHRCRGRASTTPRSRCGARTPTCCRCPSTGGATSTPRWPPARTSCTRCSRPSASSTPSSSPRRRWPCPTPTAGDHARVLGRAGRVGRPQPDRLGARRRARRGHRRAGVQRRRVRRQGGHGQPGPDRAGGLAAAAPGEVHAVAARRASCIHPKRHPIRMEYWAGCDADGRAHRAARPGWSATPARTPSSGMKVLERAAGHASGPYHVPAIDVRVGGGPHQQPGRAARSGASAPTRPSSPWRACWTGWPSRSASAGGRSASAT